MADLRELLMTTAARAADYREQVVDAPVFPAVDVAAVRSELGDLPDGPTDAADVVRQLADTVEPLLVASTGGRYFGFVTGGALDAPTAVDMLATAWDQLSYNALSSPIAAVVEDVTGACSYWALHHPPGAPDFHHRDAFVLRVEPPAAAC
jgi:hypothetical protein